MAATVHIHEMTALTTAFDKTSDTVRFKSADETTVDTNNRLQIPGSGTDYSYTKQLRFYVQSEPSVDISNLEAYSDGNNDFGTGVGVQYDTTNSWSANTDTDISGSDLFATDSGSTIALGTTDYSGTGYKESLLRLQMSVADTASPGALSAETLTFEYDET